MRERETTTPTPDALPDPQTSRALSVATPAPDDDARARGLREGLPRSYRSRHERHYVEEVTADPEHRDARSTSRQGAALEVDDPLDPRTARMVTELQDAVTGMQAALQQMALQAHPRDRVALQLLTAEAMRAEWLLRARLYLGSARPVAHTPVRGTVLIADVTRSAGSMIGLRGGTLQAPAVRGSLVLHGDRMLLATATVGVAWALFAIGEHVVQDARVEVRLVPTAGGGANLTVTQPSAVLMHRALSRFFEGSWPERPGGATAELAVQLARHAAAVHGARLDVASRPGIGTSVTLAFEPTAF